ncbi:MAG: RNA 2',3'-cyclic phosphodiesterase [Candidatus Staskawiczbacteria bacterium]|nr:RNA 2',3'-cyclic phosphodiesterase [Candidatus Staskawiczbacteria bacterium]
MEKRHKVFLAINIPDDIKSQLSSYEGRFLNLPAKWIKKENLHLTLVFLGNLTDTEIGETCIAVKDIVKNYKSFDLKFNKVCYGPDKKIPPKMVWANIEKSKDLSILKKDLQEKISQRINFYLDFKSFLPHITLAKIKTIEWRSCDPEELPDVNDFLDFDFTVSSIELMESNLSKGGPYYSVVESFSLK